MKTLYNFYQSSANIISPKQYIQLLEETNLIPHILAISQAQQIYTSVVKI